MENSGSAAIPRPCDRSRKSCVLPAAMKRKECRSSTEDKERIHRAPRGIAARVVHNGLDEGEGQRLRVRLGEEGSRGAMRAGRLTTAKTYDADERLSTR